MAGPRPAPDAEHGPTPDRERALAAVRSDYSALRRLGEEWRRDREVVLAAVDRWGKDFRFLENDPRRFISCAAQLREPQTPLECADGALTRDRDFMLAAVRTTGLALAAANDELRRDRTFVLAAVRSNGRALLGADDKLKYDREVVLEAVREGGAGALRYAARALRRDPEMQPERVRLNRLAGRGAAARVLQIQSVAQAAGGDVEVLAASGLAGDRVRFTLPAGSTFGDLAAAEADQRGVAGQCVHMIGPCEAHVGPLDADKPLLADAA